MNKFKNGLIKINNVGETTNGAVGHKSTLNPIYDLFALGGALRNAAPARVIELFSHAYAIDKELTLKCMFYIRNIRGLGQGERKTFRIMLKELAKIDPEVAKKNIANIPFYGRYDDLFTLFDTPIEKDMIRFVTQQLLEDSINVKYNRPISLLAKWMPSINASSKETKGMAKRFVKAFGCTEKVYRKKLAELRAYLKITETYVTNHDFSAIEYDKVPGLAGLRYAHLFRAYDNERYTNFINSKESKVHAGTLYPYDVAHLALTGADENIVNKYWKELHDYTNGKSDNGLCIVDTSGSMTVGVGKAKPLDAAVALGYYVATKNKGWFHNCFLTFSDTPTLCEVAGQNPAFDMKKMYEDNINNWGSSTNLEKVFDMLLSVAIKEDLWEDEMPTKLYIISDMQFNGALTTNNHLLRTEAAIEDFMTTMEKKFEKYSCELPKVIFWNVNACNQVNLPGEGKKFSYVSGCSPSILSILLEDKSGIDIMLEVLNDQIFDKVVI